MKKSLFIILSLIIVFSIFSTAFVSEYTASLHYVSEAYGIPMDILITLDQETVQSLIKDATNNRLVSSTETYVKLITDENDDIIMETASYEEYLQDITPNASTTDPSSGWMKFHTTVFEVNSTTGQASCAFTWLTPPAPRMKDVVGLALRNGTVDVGTYSGFYRHTSPNDNYNYTFKASDFRENGCGVTAKFNLRKSDYINQTNDYVFIKTNFAKEGNSEGVNGSYGHQKIGISFNPTFNIDRYGKLSWTASIKFLLHYTQDTGYVSIRW